MKKQYVADFICYSTLLVEIKAADYLTSKDESQMLNYLKATGLQVGVLINFGARGRFEWKRMVLTQHGVIDPEENVD